jgi:arginine repressor
VLLKTISKVIKKLLAKKIRNLAEKYYLLYLSQIKAQAKQGTNTALKLLTNIIQTV